ncbi:germination-related protein [Hibiscus syriacus]|uniref:Germination-related protein n=1 Tax=Hibiscus syriacus TaxID=106335 RepID=A0A6A3AFI8_HIBSY|nr:germination-related protein [Hibiscus syriacus]
MAFHVACPITCRPICFCSLGFPPKLQSTSSKHGFLHEVIQVEGFLKDPWGVRVSRERTVQVPVPKVAPVPSGDGGGGGGADSVYESAQAKRPALPRKAAAAMVAAEDYARRVELGDILVASKSSAVDEQGHSNTNVMCRMCFMGEIEGSERARRMFSCRNCGKKYHRNCLKSWAKHRDLFHWSSWTCPYCRTCEVCRSTGDPTRLMFCKMCDGAYHCYCQHPSHKVYRDSESTPMVCCDVCQRWVHCHCDGISDEKYLQFQVDDSLQYKCATCRGECYQVNDLEDAVRELWKRRDIPDRDLIASLRAAAGLPTQEEIFSLSIFRC